ncbi:IclR family transcriptional regulator [Mesorhizobium sp. M0589]|uniref:IclR family transcriptional regulator n=1 Tax=Mesorhizobium sp. M0589 TaxID=2956965 RepID=UPI0033381742
MGTVGKAISLLELFTADEPELGLSDLARRCALDKATTRRLLMALGGHGFVEQDAGTRHYRLGAGLSRLARIREACFPFLQTAIPVAQDLAGSTTETVHLSEFGVDRLITVYVEHSSWANRVNIDVGQLLPLHSTASGIAYLAFADNATVKACLTGSLETFTDHTLVEPAAISKSIGEARDRGYSICDQGHEDGVIGVAAAIRAADGLALGTIAVAAPKARTTPATIVERGLAVVTAAREISMRLNGENLQTLRRQA